jgi:hypothetical protein
MQQLMENWRHFLNESPEEIDAEFIAFLYSDFVNDLMKDLKDVSLNEVASVEQAAKKLVGRYGISIALAMGLLAGSSARTVGQAYSDAAERLGGAEQTQQMEVPRASRAALPPGYSDLSNKDAMEKAWQVMDNKFAKFGDTAPVKGGYPTKDGMKSFVYVPAQGIDGNDILPMSLMTADEYRAFIVLLLKEGSNADVERLQKMVFGTTAKWLSGTGEKTFRVTNTGYPILPPEWSIAHDVLSTDMERRILNVSKYVEENPDLADTVAREMGLQSAEQIPDHLRGKLRKYSR